MVCELHRTLGDPISGCNSCESSCSHRLIPVHGAAVGVPAEFSVSRGADGPAAAVPACRTALLQSQELLGAEALVVNLASGLDQVLKMGARQEVSQVDKFAVVLVFHVDDTPAVLSAPDMLVIYHDVPLTADHGKRDDVLIRVRDDVHHSVQLIGKP